MASILYRPQCVDNEMTLIANSDIAVSSVAEGTNVTEYTYWVKWTDPKDLTGYKLYKYNCLNIVTLQQ